MKPYGANERIGETKGLKTREKRSYSKEKTSIRMKKVTIYTSVTVAISFYAQIRRQYYLHFKVEMRREKKRRNCKMP